MKEESFEVRFPQTRERRPAARAVLAVAVKRGDVLVGVRGIDVMLGVVYAGGHDENRAAIRWGHLSHRMCVDEC
jgi:hypothetical protein